MNSVNERNSGAADTNLMDQFKLVHPDLYDDRRRLRKYYHAFSRQFEYRNKIHHTSLDYFSDRMTLYFEDDRAATKFALLYDLGT